MRVAPRVEGSCPGVDFSLSTVWGVLYAVYCRVVMMATVHNCLYAMLGRLCVCVFLQLCLKIAASHAGALQSCDSCHLAAAVTRLVTTLVLYC